MKTVIPSSTDYSSFAEQVDVPDGDFCKKWLKVNDVNFYIGWSARTIGSYNPNCFFFPFGELCHKMYLWFSHENESMNLNTLGDYAWRITHPSSFYRYMKNKKKGCCVLGTAKTFLGSSIF